jgi:NhaP-type Na+/H+ or K+/H+ antiporter
MENELLISFLQEQFILSYGGLRGAVGFSLVTILDEENPFKDIFLTTTLFVIFFTVFIQGASIKFVVSKLKIQTKSTEVGIFSKIAAKTLMISQCLTF